MCVYHNTVTVKKYQKADYKRENKMTNTDNLPIYLKYVQDIILPVCYKKVDTLTMYNALIQYRLTCLKNHYDDKFIIAPFFNNFELKIIYESINKELQTEDFYNWFDTVFQTESEKKKIDKGVFSYIMDFIKEICWKG